MQIERDTGSKWESNDKEITSIIISTKHTFEHNLKIKEAQQRIDDNIKYFVKSEKPIRNHLYPR